MKIAIIGGGFGGLAAALRLKKVEGCELCLLEAGPRLGGKIRSEAQGGYLIEHSVSRLLDRDTALLELLRDVGLGGELISSSPTLGEPQLLMGERLRPFPKGLSALSRGSPLSLKARLRALMEPLYPPRSLGEESIYNFISRRLGLEVAERLLDPLMAGLYGGDAREISLEAFPWLKALEMEPPRLLRGLLKLKKERGSPLGGRWMSLRRGMEELIHALREALEPSIHLELNTPVQALSPSGRGWRLSLEGDSLEADLLLLATPASVSAQLLAPLRPQLSDTLAQLMPPPTAVLSLGFKAAQLPQALNSPGCLLPWREGWISGAQWSSSLFKGRAPQGQSLIQLRLSQEALSLDREALIVQTLSTLGQMIEEKSEPCLSLLCSFSEGMPELSLGQRERWSQLGGSLEGLPGIYLATAGLLGMGLEASAQRAEALPELLLRVD